MNKPEQTSKNDPPRWMLQLLRWFCPEHLLESVEGDLIEEYEDNLTSASSPSDLRKANWNFLLGIIRFFRPGIILRNKFSPTVMSTIMLSNYCKVAVRNISRSKMYSFINAFGLSIAIGLGTLIYLFIQDEKSFDQFHQKKEQILRLYNTSLDRDKLAKKDPHPYSSSAWLPAKLGEVLLEELPEVKNMTRWNHGWNATVHVDEKIFKKSVSFADSGFFNMFSFPIVHGGNANPLKNKTDVVLSAAVATQLFGDENPVGKMISVDVEGAQLYTISAVLEPSPANSSIQYEIIVPMENQPWFSHNREQWGSFSYPTFVEVAPETNLTQFQTKMDALMNQHMGKKISSWWENQKLPDGAVPLRFNFDKITEIHQNNAVSWDKVSDPKYSWILGGIGVLILFIAVINYINLSLTTSAKRRIEVGVRKTIGATRKQLISQFSAESLVLTMISMILGIALAIIVLPYFNDFTEKRIIISITNLPTVLLAVFAISLVTGLLAGSYPALFLSMFQPSKVLKGGFTKMKISFAKPLVVLQFAFSAFLVISSVIMYRQMKLLTTKDLGYNKDQLIVIQSGAGWNEKSEDAINQLRAALENEKNIIGVTGTNAAFNQGWSRYGYKVKGEDKSAFVYKVDPNYIPLLGIELVAGRNFDGRVTDSTAIIVNEALVRDMGWKDPLNEYLNWREDSTNQGAKVIGVVRDYHFQSLENSIEPMLLTMDPNEFLLAAMVKINPNDLPSTMEMLERKWKTLFPGRAFDYSFVDDDVAKQYSLYRRWTNIMGLSTIFAIVIACLGLFGLAGVNAVNKTREIGIRKVMGAGESTIFVLLNRQFILLATIAFCIAAPASYYVMTNWWLSSFEARITVGWQIFAVSILGGLALALLTVSYHGIKAARINPAQTLKCE
jgi:putative ABC transport system permease protein